LGTDAKPPVLTLGDPAGSRNGAPEGSTGVKLAEADATFILKLKLGNNLNAFHITYFNLLYFCLHIHLYMSVVRWLRSQETGLAIIVTKIGLRKLTIN